MPRVSVIITALNAGAFIGETLSSILAQTYRDFEIVVVDAGSTDQTLDIVSRCSGPVRLIVRDKLSKSAGRNVGIQSSSGEYVALVDADDRWQPHKLLRQMEYLERAPSCRWVYSDCFVNDYRRPGVELKWSDRNCLYEGQILEHLLLGCFVPSPTPVLHRDVLDAVGGFDETFKRHEPEDWDLWLRVAARFPAGVVNEPLARLRVHASSLTSREDLVLTGEGALAVVRRALERNPQLPAALRHRVLATWYVRFGRGLMRAGRLEEARPFLSGAMAHARLNPGAYALWLSSWLGGPLVRPMRALNRAVVAALGRDSGTSRP
jgi:hypothetical protein